MHSYKMWKSRTSQCARTTQQRFMGVQIIEGCQSIFIKCWSLFAWHINHENAPTTFLLILQAERFLWNSNTFRKCSACEPYRKTSGRNCTIFASKDEAVCRELHMHFWRSLPPSFKENVLGAIPRFLNPTTKLLAVEFRRIFKVLCKILFCRISSGGNSTISASENEVVSHGVQTHFGCSLPVSFTE